MALTSPRPWLTTVVPFITSWNVPLPPDPAISALRSI